MQITCNRCGSSISAENLDLSSSVATCTRCDSVFDFSSQMEGQTPIKRSFSEPPKGIQVSASDDGLVIERQWMSFPMRWPILFCLGLNAYMVVGVVRALMQQNYNLVVFELMQFIMCLVVSYIIIGVFVNKTWMTINPRSIRIKHGPLPWIGNKEILPQNIEQVFVRRYSKRTENSTIVRYRLCYLDHRGKEAKLMDRLREPDHALYLEQEIESILGIQDRSIPGEYR